MVGSIEETRRGYAWPRNLRELKNYTERYLLTDGQMDEAQASAGAPSAEQQVIRSATCLLPQQKRLQRGDNDLQGSRRVRGLSPFRRDAEPRSVGVDVARA